MHSWPKGERIKSSLLERCADIRVHISIHIWIHIYLVEHRGTEDWLNWMNWYELYRLNECPELASLPQKGFLFGKICTYVHIKVLLGRIFPVGLILPHVMWCTDKVFITMSSIHIHCLQILCWMFQVSTIDVLGPGQRSLQLHFNNWSKSQHISALCWTAMQLHGVLIKHRVHFRYIHA